MASFKDALKISKLISKGLKLFKFEATSLPGKMVQKVCPNFLVDCNEYVSHPRFAITGTNGKTTTSTLLSEILETAKQKVINNKLGANMPNGIVTALANGLYRYKKADSVVLECDEAYFSFISSKFVFDYILVTNLFKDQLDRYGDLGIAREKIIKGIELNPGIKIILNADDPNLYEITEKLSYNKDKFVYYGVDEVNYVDFEAPVTIQEEKNYCPVCNKEILYSKRYYAQIGKWNCMCGAKRQKLDISAKIKVYPNKSLLEVKYNENVYNFKTKLTGLYNAYNVLGAISCALVEGIKPNIIEEALSNYSPIFGRHQKIKLENGGTLTLHLIKNPVGATEILRGLKNLKNSRMLIAINDNFADGRDVSWLWDADFENLTDFNNVIYITGKRSYDVALRLKHAGFNQNLSEVFDPTEKVAIALDCALSELHEKEDLVVLTGYTPLLEINKNLNKLIKKYGVMADN